MNISEMKIMRQLVSKDGFFLSDVGAPGVMLGVLGHESRSQRAAQSLAKQELVDIVQKNTDYQVRYAILPRDRDAFICKGFTLITSLYIAGEE